MQHVVYNESFNTIAEDRGETRGAIDYLYRKSMAQMRDGMGGVLRTATRRAPLRS